jgi:cell wall-associated NlpC family hydrolase
LLGLQSVDETHHWAPLSFQGAPNVWGGTDPVRLRLLVYAYARFGVSLPRVTTAQFAALPHLPAGVPLEPVDLLFVWGSEGEALPGHEGI